MSNGKVAIQFSNCMGNFIVMTAALRILRHTYDKIDLITEEFILNRFPAVKAMAEEFFDEIKVKPPLDGEYAQVYTAAWSRPPWTPRIPFDWRVGIPEVQVYLNMIDASKEDFEGFLLKVSDKPKLKGSRPKIALANASKTKGSRRGAILGWKKFPQLSEALIELGFDVILVGQSGELDGCKGQSFIDKLNIFETSFIISQCDLMICTDTGLMHVADALGVPILLLIGPSHVTKAGIVISEYEVVRSFISCAPCYQTGLWNLCKTPDCMNHIEVEDVLRKVFKFRLRDALYEKPKILSKDVSDTGEKVKIIIPYYKGGERIERAKRTWLYPEVAFSLSEDDVSIHEESFYVSQTSADLGIKGRNLPLLNPIMQKLLDNYPDIDYYGYFNSDIILPDGKNVRQLLPEKGKVAALHHRLDFYPDGIFRRYVGKDGFIMTRKVLQHFLEDFPTVIIGSAGWDLGLFYWLVSTYGEENVDFRFDEIYHHKHEKAWFDKDEGTLFNLEQIRSLRFFVDWNIVGKKHEVLEGTQKKRPILGIIQPRRLGDILIVLPIARWFFDRGYEVWWPLCSEWIYMQHYVNYVKFIDVGELEGSYERAHEALVKKANRVIDLGIGIGRKLDWQIPFDVWKYQEAGVPFEEKQHLQLNRDYEKETTLKKKLNLKKPYTITHSIGHYRSYDFQIPDGVEVKPVSDFSLIDWIGVLEDAEKIYCLDSSVSNLVDGLGLSKRTRFIKYNDNLRRGTNKVQLSNDWQSVEKLPVCFFTIVFNGMPFIEYHLEKFRQLPFPWHWYIIEGLAEIAGDPGANGHRARGGHIPDNYTSSLSTDGTTEYLDKISIFSDVTVIRNNDIWDSKLVMVNAPVPFIDSRCILWQVDVDEFYPAAIATGIYQKFMDDPSRRAAIIPHLSFMTESKYIVSNNSNEASSFPRAWLFEPGCRWSSHEPPILVDAEGQSLLKMNPFSEEDMKDLKFYHYGYAHPSQIRFKESYYGYKGLYDGWQKLRRVSGKAKVANYLPGINLKKSIVDDFPGEHLIPIKQWELN